MSVIKLCGAFENHIFTSSPEPDVKRMALSNSNCISMGDSMVLIESKLIIVTAFNFFDKKF